MAPLAFEEVGADGIRRRCRLGEEKRKEKAHRGTSRFARVFLPENYPRSVREGYLEYQLWDLLQGLTSYLRANLAIKELLTGLGVGNVAATASAGALGWIMLNGASMLGGLAFTWAFASAFCNDVRQWRLFADVINDVGLTLNMLAPLFGERYFLLIAGCGSVCTSMCGVAAGATKAAVSHYFARGDNLADLCAKEGSQETAVNLIGLAGGYLFLGWVREEWTWAAFAALTALHIVANVKAVRMIRFDVVNESRFRILYETFEKAGDVRRAARYGGWWRPALPAQGMSPAKVGDAEQLLPSIVAKGDAVRIGCSISGVAARDADAVSRGLAAAATLGRTFAVCRQSDATCVYLGTRCTPREILRARYCAEHIRRAAGDADAAGDAADMGKKFVDKLESCGWDVERHLLKLETEMRVDFESKIE